MSGRGTKEARQRSWVHLRTSTERSTAPRPCRETGEGLFARDIAHRCDATFAPGIGLTLRMKPQHAQHFMHC